MIVIGHFLSMRGCEEGRKHSERGGVGSNASFLSFFDASFLVLDCVSFHPLEDLVKYKYIHQVHGRSNYEKESRETTKRVWKRVQLSNLREALDGDASNLPDQPVRVNFHPLDDSLSGVLVLSDGEAASKGTGGLKGGKKRGHARSV